jgi:hypothetical protein
VRNTIRDRFEWTLNLDTRYRLIGLCIALASIGEANGRALIEGFDVDWVRSQALGYWQDGFADDSTFELFRTILDEMIGLGVLRKVEPDRYALRSANVLNLLGNAKQIEQGLSDVMAMKRTPAYDAASFRRSLDDVWRRSAPTAQRSCSALR